MSSRLIQGRITVRGRVACNWSCWLGELALPDQSALQGVLNRMWELNLTVLSVSTSPGEAGRDRRPPDSAGG
jgi:hypothetical protein